MRQFYIILLILTGTHFSYAQLYSAKNFELYTESNKKEVIFFDDFVDNRSEWIGVSDTNMEIKNGSFRFQDDNFTHLVEMPLDDKRDFEISLKLKVESKKIKKSIAKILWGVNCGVFSSNISIGRNYTSCFNQEYGEYDKSTYSYQKNHLEEFNWYTVRKIDNSYYVFVNGHYILSHPAMKNRGAYLGLYVSKGDCLVIDSIQVSYLPILLKNQKMPIFKPGKNTFTALLHSNIRYATRLKEDCINSEFLIAVKVNDKGNVDSTISYGANPLLNAEIVRVLPFTNGMWQPAYTNDTAISQWYITSISFTKQTFLSGCPTADYYYQKSIKSLQPDDDRENNDAINNLKLAAGTDYRLLKAWYNIIAIYTNEENHPKACEYLQLLEYAMSQRSGKDFTEEEKLINKNLPWLRQNCTVY